MRVIHGIPPRLLRTPLCLAAGVFDGVHIGHREIIMAAVQLAEVRGCAAAVLTFSPHPDAVLFNRPVPPLLTTLDEKLAVLGSLGVRTTIVARFDRGLATTPADVFVREILVGRLNACCVTVGEGWRFGSGGRGDAALLQRMAEEHGFFFCSCPPVTADGMLVSSTRIRAALAAGDVEVAARYLGRPYQLSNTVRGGHRRGRTLGFPTANLDPPPFKAVPGNGVYACCAGVRQWAPAVASIGVRPTFEEEGEQVIEVHFLDGPESPRLTGRRLRVAFMRFLREERRFDSAEALIAQMGEDRERARALLAPLHPPDLML